MHVHDRSLAGNRDGLLHATDAQIGADRDDLRAADFHAFAPNGRETGQRECHRVDARHEILETILAGAVGDRGPDFFKQGRAGRFNSHAGQYGARRVANGAGQ